MTIEVVESRWGGKTLSAGIYYDTEVTEEARAMLDKLESWEIDPCLVGFATNPFRLVDRTKNTHFSIGCNANRMFWGLIDLLRTMSSRILTVDFDSTFERTLSMFKIKLYETRNDDDGIGGFNHRVMFEIEGWKPNNPHYSKFESGHQLPKGGTKIGSILVVMHQDIVQDSRYERTEVYDSFDLSELVLAIIAGFRPYEFHNVERIWYHEA